MPTSPKLPTRRPATSAQWPRTHLRSRAGCGGGPGREAPRCPPDDRRCVRRSGRECVESQRLQHCRSRGSAFQRRCPRTQDARQHNEPFATAMNVEDGTMTSSPAPIPNASSARWRPAVPEPTPTADAGSHRRFKFAQLRSKAQARRSQHRDDSVDVSIRDVQRRERYANGGHDAVPGNNGIALLISRS
jgi:hypothetical protein